jgi:hypothetical protein
MAYLVQGVPLIPQQLDMACWYASAQMLIQWRRGKKQMSEMAHPDPSEDGDLVKRFKSNDGLAVDMVVGLAVRLGLRTVPPMSPTLEAIESWLSTYGPLWFAGLMPSGHAVVITGISKAGLHLNDPWPPKVGTRRIMVIDDFVKALQPLGNKQLAPNFLHLPS